jgi:hypothetical protein
MKSELPDGARWLPGAARYWRLAEHDSRAKLH